MYLIIILTLVRILNDQGVIKTIKHFKYEMLIC